jgi:hypothetical protein
VNLSCKLIKFASAEAAAFVAHGNDRKKLNSTIHISCTSAKTKADQRKQISLQQVSHLAAGCPEKHRHTGEKGSKSDANKNVYAFVVHAMGASKS